MKVSSMLSKRHLFHPHIIHQQIAVLAADGYHVHDQELHLRQLIARQFREPFGGKDGRAFLPRRARRASCN